MKISTAKTLVSNLVKNKWETRFAIIHVTTRCNAKCMDRCNIWAQKPYDMPVEDLLFAIDVLAKNSFSIVYFTGGETGLYPHLIEAVDYAKKKGLITSITTNGTMSKDSLKELSRSLDVLSVSVDHYNGNVWDEAKHVPGISVKAQETIRIAKSYNMKVYAVTFLNPNWVVSDVEKVLSYVNHDLGVPFALSYPYISSNEGTFTVGGKLRDSQYKLRQIRDMVAKVLQMKLNGSQVATTSCYLREVLRAYDGLPMKYPCQAGKTIITVDCNLNVFPCYKKQKMFNLKDCPKFNLQAVDSSQCDNKFCMINCFKEASEASRESIFAAAAEEFLSNPSFYFRLVN